MAKPPPDDLKSWSKNELVRELQRLRAVLREHAERPGSDPRAASSSGSIIDVAGDPTAQGGVLIDARSAVLLEGMEVTLVDTKAEAPVAMMMTLSGRVNYATSQIEHAYLFGPDGAAALVSELLALVSRADTHGATHGERFAAEFRQAMEERLNA
jgi:hypothetical protein